MGPVPTVVSGVDGSKYYDEDDQCHDYTDHNVRKKLGYPIQIIHQDPQFSLNPNMTVKESLLEAIKVGLLKSKSSLTSDLVNSQLEKYINALAFSKGLLDKKVKTMSGGQQRRTVLEPTTGA